MTLPVVVILSYLTLRQTAFYNNAWKSFNKQFPTRSVTPQFQNNLQLRTGPVLVSPEEETRVRTKRNFFFIF